MVQGGAERDPFPVKDPESLAREFVDLINLGTKLSASDSEYQLEKIFGLSVRQFIPGEPRSVPEEFSRRLRERMSSILEGVQVTSAFKAHLLEILGRQLFSGMLRFAGSELILSQSGIDLGRGEFGPFDPQKAQAVEGKAFMLNYHNRFVMPDLARAHEEKMDNWLREYRDRYGENPFSQSS